MYICLCSDISKAEVKKAIREGHDSIEKLSKHLQIGSHCGGCIGCVEEILEKRKDRSFLSLLKTL
jgi:bacterioferritin-associated ferredoxin